MRMMTVCLAVVSFILPTATHGQETVNVGVVVFDGFLTSEVTAPIEVFAKATSKGAISFKVMTVATEDKTVTSEEGLRIVPDTDLRRCPSLDVLIVPSALNMDPYLADEALVSFIKDKAGKARYVASNCAGAFLLGKAGLLDGRRATTYIGGTEDLKTMCPRAQVVDDQHIVVDGNLFTSIGGVTTYDATLTLLERMAGAELADKVADALYYFPWLKKSPQSSR